MKMKGKKRKNAQHGCSIAHAFMSGRVCHREKGDNPLMSVSKRGSPMHL